MLNAVETAQCNLRLGPAKLVIDLLDEAATAVEPINREVLRQNAVGQIRLAADHSRMPRRGRRCFLISIGSTFRRQWIETFAQEAGVGTGTAKHLAPAQPARHVDVSWKCRCIARAAA